MKDTKLIGEKTQMPEDKTKVPIAFQVGSGSSVLGMHHAPHALDPSTASAQIQETMLQIKLSMLFIKALTSAAWDSLIGTV